MGTNVKFGANFWDDGSPVKMSVLLALYPFAFCSFYHFDSISARACFFLSRKRQKTPRRPFCPFLWSICRLYRGAVYVVKIAAAYIGPAVERLPAVYVKNLPAAYVFICLKFAGRLWPSMAFYAVYVFFVFVFLVFLCV